MRARIYIHGVYCGDLKEEQEGRFSFAYHDQYKGPPISLTLPVRNERYSFEAFPTFFDGLLPEGGQLEALLRQCKIDRLDYMRQLIAVGADLVGAVTVEGSDG